MLAVQLKNNKRLHPAKLINSSYGTHQEIRDCRRRPCVVWIWMISQIVACVASVSVRFRNKERGTRVKDRAKNDASKRARRGGEERKETQRFLPSPRPPPTFIFWLLFHFSRGQNWESHSSVFLCSETEQKRLPWRLHRLWLLNF